MKSDRWLWIILCLGAALRLYGLGERSLSYDECQQFWASRGNVLSSNRDITLDPPFFALLLRAWSVAGRGEATLRLLPCLLGILGIPAVYFLARRVSGDLLTARIASLFFALAPYPIRYSQSVRVYSLALLLCALLPAACAPARPDEPPRRRLAIAGLTCAGLLAMYGVLWLAGALFAVFLVARTRRADEAPLPVLAPLAGGMLAAAPLYLLSIPTQMSQGTPSYFYEDKFLPVTGVRDALAFLGQGLWGMSGFFSFIHPLAGLLFGALALLGVVKLGRDPIARPMALAWLLSLAAAAGASAFRLYPFGGTRQMLYAAPLFYLFSAHGLASLRPHLKGALTLAGLAAMIGGCGVFLYRYHSEPGGQEMRPVMSYLEQHAGPGDRIIVNKDAVPQFRFYYHGAPEAVIWGKETVIRDYVKELNLILSEDPAPRFWLVFSHGWSDERRGRLQELSPSVELEDRFEAHRAAVYLVARRPRAAGLQPLPAHP